MANAAGFETSDATKVTVVNKETGEQSTISRGSPLIGSVYEVVDDATSGATTSTGLSEEVTTALQDTASQNNVSLADIDVETLGLLIDATWDTAPPEVGSVLDSIRAAAAPADAASAQLNSISEPTNQGLSYLQGQKVSGVGSQEIGTSKLYEAAGLEASVPTLLASLNQRSAEMNAVYEKYKFSAAQVASAEAERYNAAVNSYNTQLQQYNTQVDRLTDVLNTMVAEENYIKRLDASTAAQKDVMDYEKSLEGSESDMSIVGQILSGSYGYDSSSYDYSGSEYEVTVVDNGISINVEPGQYLDDIATADRDEGQCGAFVNDVLDLGIGNNYKTDKYALVNSATAVVGSAFVMDLGNEYGHTGIVESINADGSFNIVEANWKEDGTITRRTLTMDDVDGFIVPETGVDQDTLDYYGKLESIFEKYGFGDPVADKDMQDIYYNMIKNGVISGPDELNSYLESFGISEETFQYEIGAAMSRIELGETKVSDEITSMRALGYNTEATGDLYEAFRKAGAPEDQLYEAEVESLLEDFLYGNAGYSSSIWGKVQVKFSEAWRNALSGFGSGSSTSISVVDEDDLDDFITAMAAKYPIYNQSKIKKDVYSAVKEMEDYAKTLF